MIERGSLQRANHVACWLGSLSLACAEPGSGQRQGEAARAAADVLVDERVIAELASARQLSPERALELVTEDALLASELSRTRPSLGRWLERVAMARAMLGTLGEEAKAAGPPTDEEILDLSQRRFWEIDRPPMAQVSHAVVLSSNESAEARALAERIATAVSSAQSAADFQEKAKAVRAEGLSVRVESLPPVTEDGRAVDPDRPPPAGPPVQMLDAQFAAAAHRLERVGQISPVVRTSFGYHVLYLVRRIEPRVSSLEERRRSLHDEIMTRRASELQQSLLAREREAAAPEQERSALGWMEGLAVTR